MSGKADRSEINELREKDLYDQKVTRFVGQGGGRKRADVLSLKKLPVHTSSIRLSAALVITR